MIDRRSAEIAVAALTAAFGAIIAYGATENGTGWSKSGPQPGAFPFFIGLLIMVASLANFAVALRQRTSGSAPMVTREQLSRVAGFALPIGGFVAISFIVGLYVAMALYMFATLALQNGYRIATALAISLVIPVISYLLLEKGFRVALLKGPLEAALGL